MKPFRPESGGSVTSIKAVSYTHLDVYKRQIHEWFFRLTSTNNHVSGYELGLLPIPTYDKKQKEILGLIGSTLSNLTLIKIDKKIELHLFEKIIDALVYELFFPEDLHQANIHLFDAVAKAGIDRLADLDGTSLADAARELADTIFAPTHPIQGMLSDLQRLEVVRIIEGRD